MNKWDNFLDTMILLGLGVAFVLFLFFLRFVIMKGVEWLQRR